MKEKTEGESQPQVDRFALVGANEKNAQLLAAEFKRVIQDNKWAVNVGGRKHLLIEAWQYMGQRVGVVAGTERCDAIIENGVYVGHQARAIVRRISTGSIVGDAVQECRANEISKRQDGTIYERWLDARGNPVCHSISGMAQTRAQSRALASTIRFLATLAGFSGTPAEEMTPADGDGLAKKPVDAVKEKLAAQGSPLALAPANGDRISEKQVWRLMAILQSGAKGKEENDRRDSALKEYIGGASRKDILRSDYERICEFARQIASGMTPADG